MESFCSKVEFITSASRKRWAHVCGDYCDDITALLIQWNTTGEGNLAF